MLENAMLQPRIEHEVDWDKYNERMNYEFDKEMEEFEND